MHDCVNWILKWKLKCSCHCLNILWLVTIWNLHSTVFPTIKVSYSKFNTYVEALLSFSQQDFYRWAWIKIKQTYNKPISHFQLEGEKKKRKPESVNTPLYFRLGHKCQLFYFNRNRGPVSALYGSQVRWETREKRWLFQKLQCWVYLEFSKSSNRWTPNF